jgi:23S rRNA G2069 N7-methylase RlmK/C1962 C5-methylase RlmI
VGLLGDLVGQRVLHLQCNVGHDSLSLANLGAQVVGVGISDVAIDIAVRLSRATGLAAAFHQADVYKP